MSSRLRLGIHLAPETHKIICNVYRCFVTEALTFKRSYGSYCNKVQQRVVDATGITRSSLINVLNERDRLKSSRYKEDKGKSNILTTDTSKRKSKIDLYQSREIINNVFRYIIMERDKFLIHENGYFSKIQERVAKATGISISSSSRFTEETQGMPYNLNASNMNKTEAIGSFKSALNSQMQAIECLIIFFLSNSKNDSNMSDPGIYSPMNFLESRSDVPKVL